MALKADPFQRCRERLDPRVMADLGAWANEVGPSATIQTDRTLESWATQVSESDIRILEELGDRRSSWTAKDSEAAGFALAVWGRLEGVAVEDWFAGYRRVLGSRASLDVEAQAAYRQGQLQASSQQTAMVLAFDRSEESADRLPAQLRAFDGERLAMERAARGVAASWELRSREAGITAGPRDDPSWREDFSEVYPGGSESEYLDFAALPPPVGDPHQAVHSLHSRLWGLGDRAPQVLRHAASIVECCPAYDLASLEALEAELATAMPAAALVADGGQVQIPPEVRDSLRMEHGQKRAAADCLEAMEEAGTLRWGVSDGGDSAERRAAHDRALEIAEQHRASANQIADALDQRREQGLDGATWLGGAECDQLIRGFALHAVRRELERERDREAAHGNPELGVEGSSPEAAVDAPETEIGPEF